MLKHFYFILPLFVYISAVYAQTAVNDTVNIDGNKAFVIHGGLIIKKDTVPHIWLREVTVIPPFIFESKKQKDRYNKLTYNVKKVYPYSLLIKRKLNEIESSLDSIPKDKDKKAFIKKKEKELRDQFEDELVKLTISQGKILIKLVDRQTGKTTYELIKELKGSLSAFFWQSLARLFGSNLKSEYDASGDDAMIEDIIIRIENGTL